jgi:DnaJ-class molecular chaperone
MAAMRRDDDCPLCDGEGWVEAADHLASEWIECPHCEGTGDRHGRGSTKPMPEES